VKTRRGTAGAAEHLVASACLSNHCVNARGGRCRGIGRRLFLEFVFGLIVLALDVWAIVNIVGSGASTGGKILWSLLIIILPIVGFIIWFFAGPRSRPSTA
jgi:hypothetical protein